MSVFIRGSVGFGGANDSDDTRKVQELLNLAEAFPRLKIDGVCGPRTIIAIRNFQSRFILTPDGRVDPGGRTIRELNESVPEGGEHPVHPPMPKPSYWEGDSARWSQTKKLESLDPEFRQRVKNMMNELALREFKPKIFYGWRSVGVQLEFVRQGRSKVRFSFHNA